LNELDVKLEQYLDFDRGVFIEAGANDGIAQSNTLYFEKYRRWRGLLIEPIPELAAACRRNRRRCLVEHAALVPFDHPTSTIEMRFCNLMSVVRGGMKSPDEEEEHVRLGCELQGVESRVVQVPTQTLTSILDRHGLRQIDLFSLDVEGFELSVLRGLDFDKYRPRFLLVEARYRQEIDQFLDPLYRPVAELSVHDVLYQWRGAA
jgi:FkbM family methyltransferase